MNAYALYYAEMAPHRKPVSPVIVIAVAFLFCIIATSCKREKPMMASGDEWRSWTKDQKHAYLVGFLDGQPAGASQVCNKMDDLTRLKNPDPQNPVDSPSLRCRNAREEYSKAHLIAPDPGTLGGASLDVTAYSNVLDDFYRHPECRAMPYVILLSHLDDKEFKSGEELFRYVRSDPGWGSFTIPGIESCL